MMFLSGSFWDLSASPTYLQAISKAMPLTYLNDGLRDTMVYGNEGGALVNLAVIAVLGFAFFILGSRLMSWKDRRPSPSPNGFPQACNFLEPGSMRGGVSHVVVSVDFSAPRGEPLLVWLYELANHVTLARV